MIGIKEKLRRLDSSRVEAVRSPIQPLSNELSNIGAAWAENEYGRYIVREKPYPYSFLYGNRLLGEFSRLTPQSFMQASGAPQSDSTRPEDVILFDAETTGLAGGSGTCAFLFGIGFIRSEHFIVRQYFMPDYNSEKAMLNDLIREFADKNCWVSYNGKRFDLPLLKTRLVINRLPSFSGEPLHIDLLYSIRRLWKHRLPSCTLLNVEKLILGVERFGDIPGCEIPDAYFHFVTSGQFARMSAVFKHNVQDILSMAAILVEIDRVFAGEQSVVVPDSYWLFRILCDIGREEEALAKAASRFARTSNNAVRLQLQRADVLKKRRRYQEAAAIWMSLLSLPEIIEEAFEELAKLHEHIFKNCEEALAIIERFEKRLEVRHGLRGHTHKFTLSDEWCKRKQRLESKLNKAPFRPKNSCFTSKAMETV